MSMSDLSSTHSEDIDLVDDNQNPFYQYLYISRQRLTTVLDNTLEKLEIAICFEDLIKQERAISLDNPRFSKNITTLLKQWDLKSPSKFNKSTNSMKSRNKSTKTTKHTGSFLSLENRNDVHYSNLLSILQSNEKVMDVIKSIMAKKSISAIDFYLLMKVIRNYAVRRFNNTYAENAAYEKLVSHTYERNKKYEPKNEEISAIKDTKMHELILQIQDKYETVQHQKENKVALKNKFIEEINKIINDAEDKITQVSRENEYIIDLLNDEANKIINEYEELVEYHIKLEKQLRKKKRKTESELAMWSATYDQEIGIINTELEEIKAEVDKLEEIRIEQERLLSEQEEEYNTLMLQKETEEHEKWTLRLAAFIRNRNARRIQRWWRHLRDLRKAKKKRKTKRREIAK